MSLLHLSDSVAKIYKNFEFDLFSMMGGGLLVGNLATTYINNLIRKYVFLHCTSWLFWNLTYYFLSFQAIAAASSGIHLIAQSSTLERHFKIFMKNHRDGSYFGNFDLRGQSLLQSGVRSLGRLATHGGRHGRCGVVSAEAGVAWHGRLGSRGVVGGGQVTGRWSQA